MSVFFSGFLVFVIFYLGHMSLFIYMTTIDLIDYSNSLNKHFYITRGAFQRLPALWRTLQSFPMKQNTGEKHAI